MKIKFWGVRGSIASPGEKTVYYGGNTSCIEIRFSDNSFIVIDAGTGIRNLGKSLIENSNGKPVRGKIFLTHTHWDHIQGIPFFLPAYIKNNKFEVYGPTNYSHTLEEIVSDQMKKIYFPLKLEDLEAEFSFFELEETTKEFDNFRIKTVYLNHPIFALGYRIEAEDKVIATVYDHEIPDNIFNVPWLKTDGNISASEVRQKKILELIDNADLIIHDSQYTEEEYKEKIGWGHSTYEYAISNTVKSNASGLVFFHHDPDRSDKELNNIFEKYKNFVNESKYNFELFIAREGMEINL